MITVHRNYFMHDQNHNKAHFQVNPVGHLDIDIIGRNKFYHCELENVFFESQGERTKVTGREPGKRTWHVMLSTRDAAELTHLIEDAHEQFEVLMKDL
ncbi:hypothetical protein VA7868_04314 [Vibrio aerogenes CECT 7868]|uniref:Uncharacterized protein n=1 Tax=Vibrio aerogenes CECT 7868 TaxID=1216006 RepID=A0A1M6DTF3_9VIBR|nr:hypothetical protein [Vibrio aerogenes]SHI76491.1 hypothetical protein VA7868_04314 [Vibrio aerogenes CECT 7868]